MSMPCTLPILILILISLTLRNSIFGEFAWGEILKKEKNPYHVMQPFEEHGLKLQFGPWITDSQEPISKHFGCFCPYQLLPQPAHFLPSLIHLLLEATFHLSLSFSFSFSSFAFCFSLLREEKNRKLGLRMVRGCGSQI